MKKLYLDYYSHLIKSTKYDSKLPEYYKLGSVFLLSFFNVLNLLTITKIIMLNSGFFKNHFPKVIVVFFHEYKSYILFTFTIILILNNLLLFKQAESYQVKYDKIWTSLYVFSYFILSMICFIYFITLKN